jgi:hypothetical protein
VFAGGQGEERLLERSSRAPNTKAWKQEDMAPSAAGALPGGGTESCAVDRLVP